MKYTICCLLIAILIILSCFAGCVVVKPVPTEAANSAPPQQSVQPAPESPAKGPIDELKLPGYDVKTSILWDLNGDGVKETISVGLGGEREIGNDILLSVSDNGGFNTVTIGAGYFETADYLVTPNGAPCVVVSCGYEDDYSSTVLVSFDGLAPVLHGSVEGFAEDISDSGIMVTRSIDVFGTWTCCGYYEITDDFSFKLYNDYYIIDMTGCDPLVTKIEFPVELWKDGGFKPATLEAGTPIILYMTDGKTYVEFYVKDTDPDDFTEGRICFTIEDYIYFINGISEYDCFEEVPYAG